MKQLKKQTQEMETFCSDIKATVQVGVIFFFSCTKKEKLFFFTTSIFYQPRKKLAYCSGKTQIEQNTSRLTQSFSHCNLYSHSFIHAVLLPITHLFSLIYFLFSPQDQNKEVQDQKALCLDMFSMVEECRMRQDMSRDQKYLHLLKSRALDPGSAEKLQQLQLQYQVSRDQNVISYMSSLVILQLICLH